MSANAGIGSRRHGTRNAGTTASDATDRGFEMAKPVLKVLDGEFAIHRFAPDRPIPEAVFSSSVYWIARTDDELSVVCDAAIKLTGGEKNTGWACLKVIGPIKLTETGVLAGLSAVLASARISIFALSTFDTDYILLPFGLLEGAIEALVDSGYRVQAFRSGNSANAVT